MLLWSIGLVRSGSHCVLNPMGAVCTVQGAKSLSNLIQFYVVVKRWFASIWITLCLCSLGCCSGQWRTEEMSSHHLVFICHSPLFSRNFCRHIFSLNNIHLIQKVFSSHHFIFICNFSTFFLQLLSSHLFLIHLHLSFSHLLVLTPLLN